MLRPISPSGILSDGWLPTRSEICLYSGPSLDYNVFLSSVEKYVVRYAITGTVWKDRAGEGIMTMSIVFATGRTVHTFYLYRPMKNPLKEHLKEIENKLDCQTEEQALKRNVYMKDESLDRRVRNA